MIKKFDEYLPEGKKEEEREADAKRQLSAREQGKYKPLEDLASKLADEFSERINEEAPKVDCPAMPYKVQFVLEEVIKILESRV